MLIKICFETLFFALFLQPLPLRQSSFHIPSDSLVRTNEQNGKANATRTVSIASGDADSEYAEADVKKRQFNSFCASLSWHGKILSK